MIHRSLYAFLAVLALPPVAPATAQQIAIDARLGQPTLLAGAKHKAYLKVGLRGFALQQIEQRTPVNVSIVIDKSGSMSGDKIRHAKEAAQMAVRRLGSNDIVSVVAYDTRVHVLVPATKASDHAAIDRGISRLTADGNTALFAGVSKGADELRKFFHPHRVNRIILLSDGLANVGPSSPTALGDLGANLASQGISVTTLGLGLDYNEDLMTRLARASEGNHVFIEHPSSLARFFELEFGTLLSVVAQDVTIDIRCAPGVRPIQVLGRDADIVGQEVHTRINQLYSEGEKFVMLELELPAGEDGGTGPVAEVAVSYANMHTKSTETVSRAVTARYTASGDEAQASEDRDVMIKAVEMVANEKNRFALSMRDEGNAVEAEKMLRSNASWLDDNARRLNSKELDTLKDGNLDDAGNLAPEDWNRQRKMMRRKQHRSDMQQLF